MFISENGLSNYKIKSFQTVWWIVALGLGSSPSILVLLDLNRNGIKIKSKRGPETETEMNCAYNLISYNLNASVCIFCNHPYSSYIH